MKDSPLFSVVEIEVNSRCNLKCAYCPVGVLPPPPVPKFMSDDVFFRLVSELQRLKYKDRVSYHFYSEPLLRRDLERLVAAVSSSLPQCLQMLFTNGDLLTSERYECLFDAGIDHFVVTRHDGSSFPQREKQTVLLPQNLVLTNRGGLLTNVAKLSEPLVRPCYAPTDMLVVTVPGDILLCCDDSKRTEIMGNILDRPLDEIWFAPNFERLRGLLQLGRRAEASVTCTGCSNTEYFAPGENYQKSIL